MGTYYTCVHILHLLPGSSWPVPLWALARQALFRVVQESPCLAPPPLLGTPRRRESWPAGGCPARAPLAAASWPLAAGCHSVGWRKRRKRTGRQKKKRRKKRKASSRKCSRCPSLGFWAGGSGWVPSARSCCCRLLAGSCPRPERRGTATGGWRVSSGVAGYASHQNLFAQSLTCLTQGRQRGFSGCRSRRVSGWGRPTEPGVGGGGGRRPLHPGNRRDQAAARPARQRAESGQQSRAAQRRSGPQDPRVVSSTAGSRGRSWMQRAENPRSPCGVPVVTARGGTTLMLEMGEGERSARSEASEAATAGYTSLASTGGRASVEKLSAPLSLQLRVQFLGSAERKIPKSRRSAPSSPPPSRCTCSPVTGLSEDALRACGYLWESQMPSERREGVVLSSQFVKEEKKIYSRKHRKAKRKARAGKAVKVLTVQFSLCLSASSSSVSDADVHWGLYGEMEGGREGFNLLYASVSAALIVPLRVSCHLCSFSFLTTLLCSNKSKANRQYALASVDTKHESWQRKLNRLPSVFRLQVNGLNYLISHML